MRIRAPRSLIVRILLVEIATILLASILLRQTTATLVSSTINRFQKRNLTSQAVAVVRTTDVVRDGKWVVRLPAELEPIYDTGYDGRAYALLDASGRILSASRFSQPRIVTQAPRLDHEVLFRREHVIGLSLPTSVKTHKIWVVVTLNEQGPGAIVDDIAHAFLAEYLEILLGLLFLLPIINVLAVRHMIGAIKKVSERARSIGTRALDRRLEETGIPSEVAPLVHATNELLDGLEASFRRQSEFSANVAHELRTPLATLRAQIDSLTDDDMRVRLGVQIDRVSHILSQLRDLAALEEADVHSFQPVDLVQSAMEKAAELGPKAIRCGYKLALEGDKSVQIMGNALLIELALGNLIANAIKHTPSNTQITIRAVAPGSIFVSDNGPGVVADQSDYVGKRFWRADWTRTDSAGLGLSIVARIMDVHGGTLKLMPSPIGANFRLLFPPNGPS